jgi:hypothetical protein
MCKLVPADNNDPAFLICHGHVRKVLTYIQYQRKLRDILKRHHCLDGSNLLTETGTKFDFLAIKKKANK